MIGSKSFSIDPKEFLRGMGTAADTADAGFSPETDAVQLTNQPGVLNPIASPTNASTNVAGNFIASCDDFNTVGANNRFYVDDAGNYYYFNGTTITKAQTDGAGTYTDGKTDILPFKIGFLTTTTTDITLWDGTNTAGGAHFNASWWQTTKGQAALNSGVPHPIIQFQKIAWVGDGNLLHKIAEDGTVTNGFLTLASTDTIVAFEVEPGSNNMLISVTSGQNISDTLARVNKVHYFDGFSNKPTKTVIVEDQITSFLPNGGTMYAWYGQNFGIFTGVGLRFLRKTNVALSNATSGGSSGLVWKNRRCAIGTTIYYVEGLYVTAYGEIEQAGRKVFYHAFLNGVNSNALNLVSPVGNNKLGLSFASNKFYTLDVTAVDTSNAVSFYSSKYDFGHPIWIRQIWFMWKNGVANNGTPGSLQILNEGGVIASLGAIALQNTSGLTEYLHKVLGLDVKVITAQFRISGGNSPGLRRIIVFYDPAERAGAGNLNRAISGVSA